MAAKKWILCSPPAQAVETLRAYGYSRVLSCLLANRGITTPEQAEAFFGGPPALCDPMLLKDIGGAVGRIKRAMDAGERIAVYGDYDVDGVTSTALLLQYLRSKGADVGFYIPQREDEGYGLNEGAVRALRRQGVGLIVTVDTGMSAHAEAQLCRELGVDLVVTDHHEPRGELPQAVAVVNPRQPGCRYPFKELAGVGVAFKLACALEGPGSEKELFGRFGELVCIGTVADVVPLTGENRLMVMRGLELLSRHRSPGLDALLKAAGVRDAQYSSFLLSFTAAPRINAAGRMGSADDALRLLMETDEVTAERLASKLDALNRQRQSIENEILAQAEMLLGRETENDRVLVVGAEGWHNGVIGIVASRLVERYGKPSVVVSFEGDEGRASCRSLPGFNMHEALCACSGLLTRFGGHALAAGFSLRREDYAAFRRAINAYAGQLPEMPCAALQLDCELDEDDIDLRTARECKSIEPCGAGNPEPLFAIRSARICGMTPLKEGRHLRLELQKGRKRFKAVLFNADKVDITCRAGDVVDLAVELDINPYNGGEYLSVLVRDIALSAFERRRRAYRSFALQGSLPEGISAAAPARGDFAAVYRYLRGCGGRFLPEAACKAVSMDPFMLLLILDVFRELGLIAYTEGENGVSYVLNEGRKVNLEQSGLLRRIMTA